MLYKYGIRICTDYVILKAAYRNSVIWLPKTGYNGLAKQNKLPWKTPQKIRKVVQQLSNCGLLEVIEGKVILTGKEYQNHLCPTKNGKANYFIKLDSTQDLALQLAEAGVKSEISRIVDRRTNWLSQKKLIKLFKDEYRGQANEFKVAFLANCLKVSYATAKRTLSKLEKENKIEVTKEPKYILCTRVSPSLWSSVRQSKVTWKSFLKEIGVHGKKEISNCFYYHGAIFYNPSLRVKLVVMSSK